MLQASTENTQKNFGSVKSEIDTQKSSFSTRLLNIEGTLNTLKNTFEGFSDPKEMNGAITKLKVDQKINKKINQSNKKFERELIYLKLGMEKLFTKLTSDLNSQISDLKQSVNMSESSIRSNINEFNLLTTREFNTMKDIFKEAQTKNDEEPSAE